MTNPTLREEAARYVTAHAILTELRNNYRKRRITPQQYKTIRGQAIAGDLDGAIKGLGRVLCENAAKGARF